MQGSVASTLQVGPWSNSWPTMPPLVCSNWQDPGSHWSAHTADTVALELKWPLPWIYSLQELFELVILLEPRVCVSLELTQVVVRDCQNYEKIHLGFFPRKRVHRQWYFFWRYCTFFQPPNLSWFWSQREKMFTTKDLIFCYGQAQTALLPYWFFFASSFW